ncbi:serine hydrolase domain-containing protein [Enterococcus sp. AZ126]|uniref:serine hydrolase domain-containing protein n=1 Tax=Enterococcus sp. AZ126 TaxID=2774635 RepID=UPI003F25688E
MIKNSYSPQISTLLQDFTQKHPQVNITVGMLKKNKIVLDAWNSKNESISTNLSYDIGSITKLFTTSLLSKHLVDNNIDLDTNLNHYIKILPDRFYPTIMQLATHASGYPNQLPFTKFETYKMLLQLNKPNGFLHENPFHGTLNEEKMLEILSDTIIKPKQYKFEYNNFAFGVLGYILGQFSHQTSYEAINEFAFKDLKLNETQAGNTVNMSGHDRRKNPTKNWKWDHNDIISSAGSLVSTARDLLLFAHAHLHNRLNYLELTHQKYTNGNNKWDMGLGWRIDKKSSVHWHDGNAGGFSCILMLDLERETAVVIMTNYGMLNLKELGSALLSECNNSEVFEKLIFNGANIHSI